MNRRNDARLELELRHNGSKHLGAPLWTEQTRLDSAGWAVGDVTTARPTKQKFAELAADGLANKEMSAGLFVTVSTVEAALTSIYQKLGVRS